MAATDIKSSLSSTFEGLSPRARQWVMLLGGALAAFGLLWMVLTYSESNAPPKPAAGSSVTSKDARVTTVGVLGPGQVLKAEDTWVATAGRKLESYEKERNEQQRVNRELADKLREMQTRLAEQDIKLRSAAAPAVAASAPPHTAPPAPPPPRAPAPATAVNSAAAMPPKGPPTPTNGGPPPGGNLNALGKMPTGAPAAPGFDVERPALVKVAVTSAASRTTDSQGAGAGPAFKGSQRTLDNYLPVGFTRGELLGGLDAPTGGQAQSNPHPVIIRLSDNAVLPNRHRGEYKDCFVIASGYGDLSSERAYFRLENLSCINDRKDVLELRVQGNVFGEDGRYGLRGRLVTKQGQMLANALMAGIASGLGKGLAQASSTVSQSALGTIATQSGGKDAFQAGIGMGVGNALDRLANYYIKLAEATFPIIEVDAGRQVDVVITKGVRLDSGSQDRTASISPQGIPGPTAQAQAPAGRRNEPAAPVFRSTKVDEE